MAEAVVVESPPSWQTALTFAELEPALREWIGSQRERFYHLSAEEMKGHAGKELAGDIEAAYSILSLWSQSEQEIARHAHYLRLQCLQGMLHYMAANHAESEARTLLLGLQRRLGCAG